MLVSRVYTAETSARLNSKFTMAQDDKDTGPGSIAGEKQSPSSGKSKSSSSPRGEINYRRVVSAREPGDHGTSQELSTNGDVVTLLAVTFKEAALDSPTFRASMNHINEQLENIDRWMESFSKALNRLSQEMDGKYWISEH